MKSTLVLTAAIGVAVAVTSFTTVRAGQAPASLIDGVYTEEQAKRGEKVYADTCAVCHGATLAGDSGAGPILVGKEFISLWRSVGELFEKVRFRMPADNPGSLTPQQAADVLAFMLSANKYPAGKTELGSDAAPLRMLPMVEPPAAR